MQDVAIVQVEAEAADGFPGWRRLEWGAFPEFFPVTDFLLCGLCYIYAKPKV
jgi:hypothetical protein